MGILLYFGEGQELVPSLSQEHCAQGENTPWIGCQSIAHSFTPRGNIA